MAAAREDFLYDEDYDTILDIIESNLLDEDEDLSSELNTVVEEIPKDDNSSQFPCTFCTKVCLSKGGLTRHIKSKHPDSHSQGASLPPSKVKAVESILPVDTFKSMLLKGCEKLAADECYPEEICNEFRSYSSNIDPTTAYELIKPVVASFKGDLEKFYPNFYKIFADSKTPFNGLGLKTSRLLGFEVANHVIAHISGATVTNDMILFDEDISKLNFTEREMSIITYLSGYVFSTFYRRIRFSKSTKNKSSPYHEQCVSFLQAGKCTGESLSLPMHKHVDTLNRGGLWKVTEEVVAIFSVAEKQFLATTKNTTNRIDCKAIVDVLLRNSLILDSFSKIRGKSSTHVKKEIALNLLNDLLTLYIRVRSFSFAKDKVQASKIKSKATKSRSLRTSIKQQTSSLDKGH